MAYKQTGSYNSLAAGEDLSAKDYYICQLDASGNLEVAESATDFIVGVLVQGGNDGGSGAPATYQHQGIAKVIANTTVAIGDYITAHTDGTGTPTTTDGNIVIGRALTAADAGDIFSVQLCIEHLYIA